MTHVEQLKQRYKNIVTQTCNVVGCGNCHYKWDGGCSATELNNELMEIEIYGGKDE